MSISDTKHMAIIGLGANLPSKYGEPKETLVQAKKALSEAGFSIQKESNLYKTAPVPVSDDPWFCNAVVSVSTNESPEIILQKLHTIESEFGRVRTTVNAPRILDLDLIAYDDRIVENDVITVPHPRLHTRAFVLYPLRDIEPNWKHPKTEVSVDELISQLPTDQIIEMIHE